MKPNPPLYCDPTLPVNRVSADGMSDVGLTDLELAINGLNNLMKTWTLELDNDPVLGPAYAEKVRLFELEISMLNGTYWEIQERRKADAARREAEIIADIRQRQAKEKMQKDADKARKQATRDKKKAANQTPEQKAKKVEAQRLRREKAKNSPLEP